MKLRKITLLIIFSLTLLATTDSLSTDKENKLLELSKYERVAEKIQRFRKLCMRKTEKISPESVVSENPLYFGGIKPGSKYWSNIKESYTEFIVATCSYLEKDKVLNEYISVYSEELSEESLDGILAFYKSKAGKKYLKEMSVCDERMQAYYSDAANPAFEAAMKKYHNDIDEIIQNYRNDQQKVDRGQVVP